MHLILHWTQNVLILAIWSRFFLTIRLKGLAILKGYGTDISEFCPELGYQKTLASQQGAKFTEIGAITLFL